MVFDLTDGNSAGVEADDQEELGTRKWEKGSPELVGECTVEGTGRYRSVILGNDAPISPDRWPEVWQQITDAIRPHGFIAPGVDPAPDGNHFIRISNEHGDTITVTTLQRGGTTFSGDTECHPGFVPPTTSR